MPAIEKIRANEEQYRDIDAAFTPLVLEIFRINGDLLAAGNELTRDLKLTSARWQVLGALQEGPLTVPRIARNMGLSRQSVRRLVDLLTRHRQVELVPNPHHRKSDLIRLTEDGGRNLKKLKQRQRNWGARLSKGLTPTALLQANAVLRHLRKRLEQDE